VTTVAAAAAAADSHGLDEHRARLQRIARGWLARRPLFLDTETTGTRATDEIVELAILDADGTVLLEQRVKPRKPIPPDATRVHGISDFDVRAAPCWQEVHPAVHRLLHGRALVIYNAAFDLRLLVQTARVHRCPRPPAETAFCAMKLYAEWHGAWNDCRGNYRWQRLGDAARQMGLAVPENLHAASADAALTRALLMAMAGG
jgi:DNA polymerase III epsilon subunit-like protein